MSLTSVLIIGEDSPGALYHSYRRGFESLGVEVTGYCPHDARRRGSPLERSRVARRLMPAATARGVNERLIDELAGVRPELILVLKGEQLARETVRHLRKASGARIVNYYPDDPFTQIRSNRLLFGEEVLAAYDVCFTFARHLMPRYREAGVADVRYLPFARDPAMHWPDPDPVPAEHDIVFIGNLDKERVEWLEAVADHDIVIFGEYTHAAIPRVHPLRRATFKPGVYGGQFARAINSGTIALNVMRHQNARSHNMRSFESPACAAFTLSQRTPELTDLFREDEEIIFFGSRDELRAKVAHWLAAPAAARNEVALAGFRRVEHDTYDRRAEAIIEAVMENSVKSRMAR